jgi:hypothetical protein
MAAAISRSATAPATNASTAATPWAAAEPCRGARRPRRPHSVLPIARGSRTNASIFPCRVDAAHRDAMTWAHEIGPGIPESGRSPALSPNPLESNNIGPWIHRAEWGRFDGSAHLLDKAESPVLVNPRPVRDPTPASSPGPRSWAEMSCCWFPIRSFSSPWPH